MKQTHKKVFASFFCIVFLIVNFAPLSPFSLDKSAKNTLFVKRQLTKVPKLYVLSSGG